MRKRRNEVDDKFLLAIFIALFACILARSACASTCSINAIEKEARRQHFDPTIAVAVATVESNLDMDAIGEFGEVGCFQIRPELARPNENLFNMKTNIKAGIRHLKYWQRNCPTAEGISFVNCYNAGARHPKYPFLRPYVQKVVAIRRQLYYED